MISHMKTNKRLELNVFSVWDKTVLIRANWQNVYYWWEKGGT